MPLDTFQTAILATLAKRRSGRSAVSGAAAFHQHGYRLTGDIDLFNTPDIDIRATSHRDIKALRHAGYDVETTKAFEDLIEVSVGREGEGRTDIQWVRYSGLNFYAPVDDEVFGKRLHMADLAINKVLAAASRRQPRDIVDLYLVHENIMPIWTAAWAAPGKDEAFNPRSILESINRNMQYAPGEVARQTEVPESVSVPHILSSVRAALETSERLMSGIPPETAGSLIVNASDRTIRKSPNFDYAVKDWATLSAVPGESWPSGIETDALIVRTLIQRYGRNGSAIFEDKTAIPERQKDALQSVDDTRKTHPSPERGPGGMND